LNELLHTCSDIGSCAIEAGEDDYGLLGLL
jgi:hypothetical protein